MTVAELIEALKAFPPDALFMACDDEGVHEPAAPSLEKVHITDMTVGDVCGGKHCRECKAGDTPAEVVLV